MKKAVILCGGQGTRIKDVSEILPKPMLPIGGRPILWHIMKIYSQYGFNDFVLCLGYKGWVIKEFFLNYLAKTSDVTLTLGKKDSVEFHNKNQESNWKVTLVDTGEDAQTGLRLLRAKEYLKDCGSFSVTYGDGVADVNIDKLLKAHQRSGLAATLTGVKPSGRFGEIEAKNGVIQEFNEKPQVSTGLVNGGFMIFNKEVLTRYIDGKKNESLESDVLPKIVKDKKLGVYEHAGFWQCVDTSREYTILNELWDSKKAFWRTWE